MNYVYILKRVFFRTCKNGQDCKVEIAGVFSSLSDAQAFYNINHKHERHSSGLYTDGEFYWDYIMTKMPVDRMDPLGAADEKIVYFDK